MGIHLAVSLDDDQTERLEALAADRHATVAEIAATAIAEYLDEDASFRRAVDEGLLAGRAGDVSDFGPFASDLRSRIAVRVAETGG